MIRTEYDPIDECYSIFSGERKVAMVKEEDDANFMANAFAGAKGLRSTRTQEIEALAEKMYLAWNAPADVGFTEYAQCLVSAEKLIDARDEWRKWRSKK